MVLMVKMLFLISTFIIFWGMIGYPYSIKLINKICDIKPNQKAKNYFPTVTVMVVAHNEEKVIKEKLKNIISLDYPKQKIEFLISSDNSTDSTNNIVKKFINENPEMNIRLYKAKKRMGKTNAQNEAQKTVKTEYLVMTDANSMLDSQAVKELMSSFTSNKISYVTGKLTYTNRNYGQVTQAESNYWDTDLKIREVEAKLQTITAGNGAIYACRNSEYIDFDPVKSHDSSMPIYFALGGKRAITNHDAIAYEKSGENIEDEFGRKVRMNRVLLSHIIPDIRIINIIKYKWFSYFYFGHRTCRYLLWIAHFMLFITNLILLNESIFYVIFFLIQLFFGLVTIIKITIKIDNKYMNLIYYYSVTIMAQWVGVYKTIIGNNKPFWEKAKSTR